MAVEGTGAAPGEQELEPSLIRRTLAELEWEVSTRTAAKSEAEVLEWLNISEALLARVKHLRQTVERVAMEWIGAHGEIHCGPVIYSIGKHKEVNCRDVLKCTEMLLNACDGDLEQLCACLRPDPFRYGACAKLLGEATWNHVFTVGWSEKLALKRVDTRFIR